MTTTITMKEIPKEEKKHQQKKKKKKKMMMMMMMMVMTMMMITILEKPRTKKTAHCALPYYKDRKKNFCRRRGGSRWCFQSIGRESTCG